MLVWAMVPVRCAGLLAAMMAVPGCSTPAPSGHYYDAAISDAVGDGRDQRCIVETYVDNECDRCENDACCATRFACYDDMKCFMANRDFDACLADAGTGSAACWDAFAASTVVAAARRDCQRKSCKTQCEVP